MSAFHRSVSWLLSEVNFLMQVNKRCRFLLDFEQEVKRALVSVKPDSHPFGGQEVDASSLGWAMSAVSSRAFRLYGEKDQNGDRIHLPMMLPLIDMCNHSFNPNARIVQEEDSSSMKMQVKACFLIFPIYCPNPHQIVLFRLLRNKLNLNHLSCWYSFFVLRLWLRQQSKKMTLCYFAMAV